MNELLFTPAAILDLLVQIDELHNKDISIVQTLDNKLQLTIGNSTYEILPDNNEVSIDVPNDIVNQVSDANMAAYEQLAESELVDLTDVGTETIESGIIKETIKTLLVGGLVRLTGKLLK